MSVEGKQLEELLTHWVVTVPQIRNESEKNKKKKKEFLARFLRVFGGKPFTPDNIQWYTEQLRTVGCHPDPFRSKPWSIGSIITEAQTLRAFTSWLYLNEHIPHNFARQIIKPKPDYSPKDMISLEEAKHIVELSNEVNPRDHKRLAEQKIERKFYLKMLLYTGVRKSELKSVRGEHLFMDVPTPYMELKRKGGRWDKVVIPQWSIEELRKRVGWERVFLSNLDGVARSWKEALLKAGVKKHIPLHRFRHMQTTEMIDAGASVADVQQLMAHRDVNVTLGIYRQNSVATKTRTEELYNPLWRREASPERMIEYIVGQISASGVQQDNRFDVSVQRSDGELNIGIKRV